MQSPRFFLPLLGACLITLWTSAATGEEQSFYRGINLNGPTLTVEGQLWEGQDLSFVASADARFDNPNVALIPAVDDARAQMIRSSLWSPAGQNRVELTKIDPGRYSVFLYVWEDNDSQTFDVLINEQVVQQQVVSGNAGQWQRLGPFVAVPVNGSIVLGSRGGHANYSGVELWRDGPAPDPPPPLPTDPAIIDAFDKRIAPILAQRCLDCHNANDRKGSLDLSNFTGAFTGGESGLAISPGKADESLLWEKIASGEMPPDNALPTSEAETLREWINSGAQWGTEHIDPYRYSSERRGGYDWWSLQPIKRHTPPPVANTSWPHGSLDHFILAKLESAGLRPSAAADRRVLIRRVYFDLIGLPPTPEEVTAFVNDADPAAYEKVVDRLLDSPHYGERWARHWLDVVRFGESQGFERNKMRENAWKYRDWVIEALNSDMPYDRFVRWQLAGDVLQPDDPLSVIASSFLVSGPYDLTAYTDGTLPMRAFAREEEMEGLVATVSQTFLGLTINCARCHDHKFDPVSQREYYQITAALAGTQHGDERECLTEAGKASAALRIAQYEATIAQLQQQKNQPDSNSQQLDLQIARLQSVVRLLQGGLAHLSVPKEPGVLRVLARGDFREPRDPVAPSGLIAFSGAPRDWQLSPDAPEAERRKALAEWITHPGNPLLARVMVNRLWSYHFGVGLVNTPNDFGFNGGRPSHPELLDWLASEFMSPQEPLASEHEVGLQPWSIKHLHRLILLSAAYQQSSTYQREAAAVDGDNRLLWRFNPRRLEAETLRDAVLTVSGELNPAFGGPGFRDFTVSARSQNQIYEVYDAVGPEFNRRTIYRTWVRTGTNPLLDVLDCPDPSVSTPRRSVTTTPIQALSLLNHPFMERMAAAWAQRLESQHPERAAQIAWAYQQAFARIPTDEERTFAESFVAAHGLSQFCVVLLNANEFLYID